jgi:hypothetical protein
LLHSNVHASLFAQPPHIALLAQWHGPHSCLIRLVAHAVTPHTGSRRTWRAARVDIDTHGSRWSPAVEAATGCKKTAWGTRKTLWAEVDAAFEKTGNIQLKSATFLDRIIGPKNLRSFLDLIKQEGKDKKKRDMKQRGKESKKRDAAVLIPKKRVKHMQKPPKEQAKALARKPPDVDGGMEEDDDEDEEEKGEEEIAQDADDENAVKGLGEDAK